nr:hypothetical protein [Desulfocapsaceae bacterium]
MKIFAYASAVTAFTTILFAGSFVQAGPASGDEVTLEYGPNHKYGFSGGDFLLESTANDYAFVTFCLEKDEYFHKNTVYTVESVTNYANKGGVWYDSYGSTATKDYISDATKWLMNEYTFNYDGLKQ